MSRALRLDFANTLWHVTHRGNEQRPIYRDAADCSFFLKLLAETVERFRWILTAYVLMVNHYHLCVELAEDDTLSRGVQWLDGNYVSYFNWRYRRSGHLYHGRFKGHIIEKEIYFQNVARYIVLNPVRAGMCSTAADYEWSSYRATAGITECPTWLARNEVLRTQGRNYAEAHEQYARFVGCGLGDNPWENLIGQIYLGSKDWAARMRALAAERPISTEIPRAQRRVGRPSPEDILNVVANVMAIAPRQILDSRGREARMMTAWLGFHESLLTQREIAGTLGISSGYVSKMLKECKAQLSVNSELKTNLATCVSTLRGLSQKMRCDPNPELRTGAGVL